MFSAVCRLHSMIREHDQIVVIGDEFEHVRQCSIDLPVRVPQAIAKYRGGILMVRMRFVVILPKPVTGLVSLAEHAKHQIEILAPDQMPSQRRLHANARLERYAKPRVGLLRVARIPMGGHGVLTDVPADVSGEGARYRGVPPESELRSPLDDLHPAHVVDRAVAGDISQPAAHTGIAHVLVETLQANMIGEHVLERVGAILQLALVIRAMTPGTDAGQHARPDGALKHAAGRIELDRRAGCKQVTEAG